jgi:hypothetical protein
MLAFKDPEFVALVKHLMSNTNEVARVAHLKEWGALPREQDWRVCNTPEQVVGVVSVSIHCVVEIGESCFCVGEVDISHDYPYGYELYYYHAPQIDHFYGAVRH